MVPAKPWHAPDDSPTECGLLQLEIDSIVRAEFGGDPIAPVLIREFLDQPGYSRSFSEGLIAVAAGRRGACWECRRAAVLMLENQALRISADDERENSLLLEMIGAGAHPPAFVIALRGRLSRLARVHQGIRGHATATAALGDFLHVARHECKLTLAPYLFTAEEITARILSLVRCSEGLPYWAPRDPNGHSELEDNERRILAGLNLGSSVYWTGEQTPSSINALVEYPIGTVVLVIKLPGSYREFELKRGGIRGKQPVSVRHWRGAHRLYGGSGGSSNDAEARVTLRLTELYLAVHGRNAPISSTISISCIQTVPAWQGEAQVLPYFTDESVFGEGYHDMRTAMRNAVRDLESVSGTLDLPGPIGLTVRFLRHMPPRQAILKNSTSFRLDLLRTYLSEEGPRTYFTEGLGLAYSFDDARRFADDLLEEVLGLYMPPGGRGPYADYVRRALAIPANRKRADSLYTAHLREAGIFWGTLIATGGFSQGESFVPRNVGLKSRWRNPEWTVDIVFMDHDILQVPGDRVRGFEPLDFVSGMQKDEGYLFGADIETGQSLGVEGCLASIYGVGEDVRQKGLAAFGAAVAEAYRKTRRMMVESPDVRGLFQDQFLERIALWESLLWSALQPQPSQAAWKTGAEALMVAAGCGPRMTDEWTRAATQASGTLDRYAGVFDPRYLDFSRSQRQPAG
jgi:hypothetical protein